MSKKTSESKDSQKTKSSKFEELQRDEQFPEFLQMKKLTTTFDGDFESLSSKQQREYVNEFWAWKESGSPGLKMPELKAKKVQIQKIYREKHLGKQWLFYVDEHGQKIGIELKRVYGTKELQDPDDATKKKTVEDTDNLLRTDRKHTIPYTESKAKEFMDIANQTSVEPTFYLIRGKRKVQVTDPGNFTGDFDELMKRANNKEEI